MLEQFVEPGGLKSLLVDFESERASPQRLWAMLSAEVWLSTYFGDKIDVAPLH